MEAPHFSNLRANPLGLASSQGKSQSTKRFAPVKRPQKVFDHDASLAAYDDYTQEVSTASQLREPATFGLGESMATQSQLHSAVLPSTTAKKLGQVAPSSSSSIPGSTMMDYSTASADDGACASMTVAHSGGVSIAGRDSAKAKIAAARNTQGEGNCSSKNKMVSVGVATAKSVCVKALHAPEVSNSELLAAAAETVGTTDCHSDLAFKPAPHSNVSVPGDPTQVKQAKTRPASGGLKAKVRGREQKDRDNEHDIGNVGVSDNKKMRSGLIETRAGIRNRDKVREDNVYENERESDSDDSIYGYEVEEHEHTATVNVDDDCDNYRGSERSGRSQIKGELSVKSEIRIRDKRRGRVPSLLLPTPQHRQTPLVGAATSRAMRAAADAALNFAVPSTTKTIARSHKKARAAVFVAAFASSRVDVAVGRDLMMGLWHDGHHGCLVDGFRAKSVLGLISAANVTGGHRGSRAKRHEESVRRNLQSSQSLPLSFGPDTRHVTHTVYLRRSKSSSGGLGLRLRNIDGRAVIRGFTEDWEKNQERGCSSPNVLVNDVIVSVNHLDARSCSFEKMLEVLQRPAPPPCAPDSKEVLALTTVEDVVCLRLARPTRKDTW